MGELVDTARRPARRPHRARRRFLDSLSAAPYNDCVIQIYGRKKCKDTKKAERFFKERRIPIQSIDLDVKAPGPRELELFAQAVGAEELIDTEAKEYRARGLAYMDYDPLEEIAEDPALLRTPIVRDGREVAVGADEAFWKRLAEAQR